MPSPLQAGIPKGTFTMLHTTLDFTAIGILRAASNGMFIPIGRGSLGTAKLGKNLLA